jgi:hypothetical protein
LHLNEKFVYYLTIFFKLLYGFAPTTQVVAWLVLLPQGKVRLVLASAMLPTDHVHDRLAKTGVM